MIQLYGKIIVVEYDKRTNECICEYIKPAGHEVIAAYNGREALALLRRSGLTKPLKKLHLDGIVTVKGVGYKFEV